MTLGEIDAGLSSSMAFNITWLTMIEDLGGRASLAAWYRVGRYVRANSWQLFFFLDVALRPWLAPDAYPVTRWHDRLLEPLIDHRLGNAITAILVFGWVMFCLGPWFWLCDRYASLRGHEPAG